jgi:hypothetical protein
MSTSVVRVPTDVHLEAKRFAALCGDQPGELLAHAWREYVVNHREEFADDLERAAKLMRDASLDELVRFAQDSHRTTVVVDVDELEAARKDDKVRQTLARADELYERFERAGHNI